MCRGELKQTSEGEATGGDEAVDDGGRNSGRRDVTTALSREDGRGDESGEKEDQDESEEALLDADRGERLDATGREKGVSHETETEESRDAAECRGRMSISASSTNSKKEYVRRGDDSSTCSNDVANVELCALESVRDEVLLVLRAGRLFDQHVSFRFHCCHDASAARTL